MKTQTYQYWTEDEDQVLLGGREDGCTFKEIGEYLGRSTSATQKRYYRLMSQLDSNLAEAETQHNLLDVVTDLAEKLAQSVNNIVEILHIQKNKS